MEYNSRALQVCNYPVDELVKRAQRLKREGRKLFDFGPGDPIEETPAFIRDTFREGVPLISQYPTTRGIPALRNAISGYLKRRFEVLVDAESEILPCTGSKEGIYNLAFLFIGPANKKNIVIGHSPSYFVAERSAIVAGATYYCAPLNPANDFLLELQDVPAEILRRTAIAWLNYPHNPSGTSCSLEYLQRQYEIARKFDILLCSDECYCDLYLGKEKPPSLLQISSEGVLVFNSCSKRSGMTGYRSGFIAGDKDILRTYAAFRSTIGVATPTHTQLAATAAWNDDAHVELRREAFRKKRKVFEKLFAELSLEYAQTDATFYLWVKAPHGLSADEYASKLLDLGILLSPGRFFGENCPEHFRVALVPHLPDCKEAADIWRSLKL